MVNQSYRICFYRATGGGSRHQSPTTRYFWEQGRPAVGQVATTSRSTSGPPASWGRTSGFSRSGCSAVGYRSAGRLPGPAARLVGFDIDPAARDLTDPRFPVVIGDQADPADLARVHEQHGRST